MQDEEPVFNLQAAFCILHCLHAFLDESADGLELGMAGAADPLEDAHFAGRQDGAGLLQAAQGHLVIEARTRADGIDGDVNAEIQGQQIEGRVQHADVRFDAAQHDLRPGLAVERLHDAGHGTAS